MIAVCVGLEESEEITIFQNSNLLILGKNSK
jgi:hypothetical protein